MGPFQTLLIAVLIASVCGQSTHLSIDDPDSAEKGSGQKNRIPLR